jgi:tetrahydromethanopterin S-methyltransferase subunit G
MSDEPENLVLNLLRAIRADVTEIRADLQEVKRRLTTLEIQVGNLVATEESHYAQVMQRMDRHEARLDRMERRLELVDAPATS